jgi:hypothetical protein
MVDVEKIIRCTCRTPPCVEMSLSGMQATYQHARCDSLHADRADMFFAPCLKLQDLGKAWLEGTVILCNQKLATFYTTRHRHGAGGHA